MFLNTFISEFVSSVYSLTQCTIGLMNNLLQPHSEFLKNWMAIGIWLENYRSVRFAGNKECSFYKELNAVR